MFDAALVQSAAARLRLGADPRRRLGQGAWLGRGPGASLEFHDHRDYQPGDDTRHVDWAVFARSGNLVIRRHRQEVQPLLEVLLDNSASMATHAGKAGLAATLAALLLTLAEAAGAKPRLWLLGAPHRRVPAWRPALSAWQPTGGLDTAAPIDLAPAGERILISDGLWPAGGAAGVRRFGHGAGRLCLVQVLGSDDGAPHPSGASRLVDVESGHADLVVDEAACAAYRARFARHQDGWRTALSGRGAGLVTCHVEAGFVAAERALLAAGIVGMR
jgi:uncharacterized protein (DUF58 family)